MISIPTVWGSADSLAEDTKILIFLSSLQASHDDHPRDTHGAAGARLGPVPSRGLSRMYAGKQFSSKTARGCSRTCRARVDMPADGRKRPHLAQTKTWARLQSCPTACPGPQVLPSLGPARDPPAPAAPPAYLGADVDVCRLFPLNSFITALESSFLNDCFNSHKLLVPPLVTQALLPGQGLGGGGVPGTQGTYRRPTAGF